MLNCSGYFRFTVCTDYLKNQLTIIYQNSISFRNVFRKLWVCDVNFFGISLALFGGYGQSVPISDFNPAIFHITESDLDNIIRETDAVMVARGDLGVEIPMQEVPVVQKKIVQNCLNESKPVIIATQMMESMIDNPAPTRAEVNDVANSVLDGADALMLSGETSVGKHPAMVIKAMYSIIRHLETKGDIYYRELNPISSIDRIITDSICQSSVSLAEQAFKISSYRPKANIFVFTDNRSILNMLSLVWGVRGFYYDKYVSTDHTIADLKLRLKREGMVKEGELVINIASMPITERGQSNMMKLSMVN